MVSLLVVIASLFVWRASSKVSECGRNDGFVIDGDSVDVVSSNEYKSYIEPSTTSKFHYNYYGLFLAD